MRDNTPPAVNCAPELIVPATGLGYNASVVFPALNYTDDSGTAGVRIVYSLPDGIVLPLGTHPLNITGTDAEDNAAVCTTLIQVVDATPPLLACFPPVAVDNLPARGYGIALVRPELVAVTDNSGETLAAECSPANGTQVAIPGSAVVCSAQDRSAASFVSQHKGCVPRGAGLGSV